MLDLAGSSLESLCCEVSCTMAVRSRNLGRRFGSFRCLTELELASCDGQQLTSYLHPVSQLGLVELRLTKCLDLSELRFSSSSLTALKRLHLDDESMPSALPFDGPEEAGRRLQMLGDQLVALPSLQQVSGRSKVFLMSIGKAFRLRNWQFSEYESQDKAGESKAPSNQMMVWRKPAA